MTLSNMTWGRLFNATWALMAVAGLGVPSEALAQRYGTAKPESVWNSNEKEAAQVVRAWFAAWEAGDPEQLGQFVAEKVRFRVNPTDKLMHGRDALKEQVSTAVGRRVDRKLTELYVVGADNDTAVLTKWDETHTEGVVSMASFFRVKDGLIVEWSDTPLAPMARAAATAGRGAAPVSAPRLQSSAQGALAQGMQRPPSPPQQGTQATAQDPANYTRQETEAVAVIEKLIKTMDNDDAEGHMALIADNIVFRGDPTEDLQYGARAYCEALIPNLPGWSGVELQGLYVVGGERDTTLLIKRVDYFPAGRAGPFDGLDVPVAVYYRVQNGKVVEWYDMPLVPVGPGAMSFPTPPAGSLPWRKAPAICSK